MDSTEHRAAKKFVLFGGNVPTERGDPGTWTYSPDDNRWEPVPTTTQPPARAHSRLADGPVSPANVFLSAAVDESDTVLVVGHY